VVQHGERGQVGLDDVRARDREDTESGEERFGLRVVEHEQQLLVSFPMSAVLWEHRDAADRPG